MSTTTTITKTSSLQPQALILRLTPESLKKQTSQLAKEMYGSTLFTLEEKSKVLQWESELNQIDMNDKESSEDVSIQLVFLLTDVIYPAIKNTQNDQLLEFEDKLIEILRASLPKEASVDQFIEECQAFDDEDVIFRQKLAIIEDCFDQQILALYGSANEINEELAQQFEAAKLRLHELTDTREKMSEQMHVSLVAINQKVDQVSKKMTATQLKMQGVGQRLQNEKQTFKQLVQDSQHVVKKKVV
jgi:hypothetical protein